MNRIILIIAAFILVVAAAYFVFQNALPSSNRFVLSINDCNLETDKELKMKEGNEITLLVTADQDAEFHIHGYDLKRDLTKDQEEKIVFKASDPGKYEFELEDVCELGELVVTDSQGNVPEKPTEATPSAEEENHD